MTKVDRSELSERRSKVLQAAKAGEFSFPGDIRRLRLAIGLSQTKFAKMLGLPTRTIAEIEAGTANPTIETLNKIGRPFGLVAGLVPKKGEDSPQEEEDVPSSPGMFR